MGGSFDVNAGLVMMGVVRRGHPLSHRGRQYPARSNGALLPIKKPMVPGGKPSATQRIATPAPPYDRTTKDWTTIAWPTNIQSRTPDGQFGPAKLMTGWSDCWFMVALRAVANDQQGRQILAGSIKQATDQGIRGYAVTFQGAPNHTIFISDQTLDHCLDINGGDADTRLIELAADKFFNVRGHYKSLFVAAYMNMGMNQDQAEQCFYQRCRYYGNQDPMTINPMRQAGYEQVAFFMFSGVFPDCLSAKGAPRLQPIDIMAYLNRYATNDRDGTSIVIAGIEDPLGATPYANELVEGWDVIRTEIAANGTVAAQAQAFLNALDRWLETPEDTTWQALRSAARNLKLQHISPVAFVVLLNINHIALRQNHRARLRSGVQEVLAGGPGCIGFPGGHCESIEGINATQNTFTYSDPNFQTVVHTAELSRLIQAIANSHVSLTALKPAPGHDAAESSHAGEKRGRHLLTFHRQAVNDGKIDPAEIGPLANLMAMDAGAFRHVYDSDHNGVIEGGELKAVQRRVDRWAAHLTLTPVWS